jgi:hypothetical protein
LCALVDAESCRHSKRHPQHSKITSHENIDNGYACFVAYIISNIIKPKEVGQGNLWQKIFVVILDLNAADVFVSLRE